MQIVFVEIENFRGIRMLRWAPSPGVNCLIGPGDSTKTTILDAIELCLNPRSYTFADDCDFYNLDFQQSIRITTTLAGLPLEFRAEDRYGLYLRGWNAQEERVEDEPRDGLEDALSIAVVIDKSLEARWSIFNERIGEDKDPPSIRYKDAKQLTTTRLGPYAERHLSWGRSSVLTRIGEASDGLSLQLAEASRAARQAFRGGEQAVFSDAVTRAEQLSKLFAVPVRGRYTAELDVQGVNITSGGIALHDESLPLRRLGTGSSRLIVSALQHDAGPSHIALIDEIEHGLEPHRLARLLRYLKASKDSVRSQIFLTTHSPVVIRELTVEDIFAVRSSAGTTTVKAVATNAKAQMNLRRTPEAFLARKILVCEGRTEEGLARGLDAWWSAGNRDSFALQGAVAVSGTGKDTAPSIAEHLLDLGYSVFLLLDSDVSPSEVSLKKVLERGGVVEQWQDKCSVEERVFLDLPWQGICKAIQYAEEIFGSESVVGQINHLLDAARLEKVADLSLPSSRDSESFRRLLGGLAKKKEWYKSVERGERLAAIVGPDLGEIAGKPLALTLTKLRTWIDA